MQEHKTTHLEELGRLRKIQGQIRGVIKMIEDRRYCIDILTQIAAVQGALQRVQESILERHLRSCVSETVAAGSDAERATKVNEIIELLRKTRR
ncbi:MAG: metal-sensitive transcriptional regulator [bacterium]|jgi:DNA-binding FrmR family transcriptional regulator|nr:metal-sensitive transcriptional regulator [candidate division KSB1 bacterium]MDH7559500.1 metal-sensitive transcriptional regulator [bacterium]